MNNLKKELTVAHSVFSWLPLTMTWVYNQLKYMDKFSSIVLANTTCNLEHFPWEPIYCPDKKHYTIFRVLRKLKLKSYPSVFDTAIKKHKPVILHSHFGDRGWYDLPLAKKYQMKHVVTFYGYDVNMLPTQYPIWKERYKELFGKAGLFLCEGPHMAKCLINLGCPEEKVKVQRLGVEVDKIPFVPRKIGDDGLIKILIAGTFREKKGIPYALEAIGMLKDKYPNIRVTVMGGSTGQEREEKEKRKIMDVIKRYNLEPVTRMLGFQPHAVLMKEAYEHHIFLSPSVTASDGDTEGGAPVTIIEMAASGMPVVSTWHCDIPEVVKDGETGHLVRERDVEALISAIEKLIEKPILLHEFGIAATYHIGDMFAIEKTIIDIENLYLHLMEMHEKYPYLKTFSREMNISSENLVKAFEIERNFHERILKENDRNLRKELYKEVYGLVHPLYGKRQSCLKYSNVKSNPKKHLVRLFQKELRGKSVLEIGCGQGFFLKAIAENLPHQKLTGIDISSQVLPNPTDNIEFIESDIIDFTLTDKYDIVFSDNVMEHIAPQDVPSHLISINNALKDDGKLILIMPNRLFGLSDVTRIIDFTYSNRVKAMGTHLSESTYTEMSDLLKKAGFKKLSSVLPLSKIKFLLPWIRINPRLLTLMEKNDLILKIFYKIKLLRKAISNLQIILICEK